jgi:hypothetical protein
MSVVKGMASEDVSWILERTTSGTIYRMMHLSQCRRRNRRLSVAVINVGCTGYRHRVRLGSLGVI